MSFRKHITPLPFLIVGTLLAVGGLSNPHIILGQEDEKPHWTYDGEDGPEHWGELDESYALCGTGRAQSPIDISDAQSLNLVDLNFSYTDSALNIFNNGHTIQVNYDTGSSIIYNEAEYQLAQFHFHHPSEHTLNGTPADMELHLVHQDAEGDLAVVGVLLVVGDDPDADFTPIFEHLPATEGEPDAMGMTINAANLLPDTKTFYTYTGSLTTPPCSEDVRWLVLTTPVVISEAEMEAFLSIFEHNARPVQPLNQRDLLQDNN